MPNWCYTEYGFTGESAALDKLECDIENFTTKNYIENGFGKNWLGNIATGYGFSYEDVELPCRGQITYVHRLGDVLYVNTETAWCPMPEMWDKILQKYFQSEDGDSMIEYVFISEEPGMEIYINTDTEGDIFPDRYLLELGELPEHKECQTYYMADKREVIETVNQIFAVNNESYEEVIDFIERRRNDISESGDGYLLFHKYDSR